MCCCEQRLENRQATKIGALIRGFVARRRTKALFTQELDAKLTDIGKVKQLLKTKGVPFVTPVDAIVRCLRLTRVLDSKNIQVRALSMRVRTRVATLPRLACDGGVDVESRTLCLLTRRTYNESHASGMNWSLII